MADNEVLRFDNTANMYRTHMPDAKEVIRQSLYDTAVYNGATGQTELSFFQTPMGQNSKTFADTNMQLAGQLPAGKSFLIEGIGLYLLPNSMPNTVSDDVANAKQFLNDVYTVAKGGHLQLYISSKNYLEESPLMCFPAQTGIESAPALSISAADSLAQSDYASLAGQPYMLSPANLMLVPTTNFSVTLRWPTVVPLPSAENMRIVCKLYGVMYRWVQ